MKVYIVSTRSKAFTYPSCIEDGKDIPKFPKFTFVLYCTLTNDITSYEQLSPGDHNTATELFPNSYMSIWYVLI